MNFHFFDKNKKIILLSITIFLFSFLIRILLKNNGLWHHDSVQLAIAVEDFIKHGDFHGISGGKEGLVFVYSLFYLLPYYLFNIQSAEFSITIATIFFSSLAAVMFFIFLNKLINNKLVSFLTSILFSISPIILSSTTYASSHGLDIFLIILLFYLIFLGIEKESNKYLLIAALLFGLSLFVRPSNILLIIPIVCLILFSNFLLKKPLQKNQLLYFLLIFILFSLIFLVLNIKVIVDLASYNALGFSEFLFAGFKDIVTSLTIIGLIFLVLGIILLIYKKQHLVYFLLIWFFVLFFYHANVSSYAPRFLASALIPLFVLLGYGLIPIFDFHKYLGIGIAVIIALLMITSIYPILEYRHSYSGVKEYSLFVKDHTEQDAVIIAFGDDQPFLSYYANRSSLPCNYYKKSDAIDALRAVNELIQQKPVYVSESCILRNKGPFLGFFYDALFMYFRMQEVDSARYEDYHKNDLRLDVKEARLYRLMPKYKTS